MGRRVQTSQALGVGIGRRRGSASSQAGGCARRQAAHATLTINRHVLNIEWQFGGVEIQCNYPFSFLPFLFLSLFRSYSFNSTPD